jgi:hypothetical protein
MSRVRRQPRSSRGYNSALLLAGASCQQRAHMALGGNAVEVTMVMAYGVWRRGGVSGLNGNHLRQWHVTGQMTFWVLSRRNGRYGAVCLFVAVVVRLGSRCCQYSRWYGILPWRFF